jgi:hypothetical protein
VEEFMTKKAPLPATSLADGRTSTDASFASQAAASDAEYKVNVSPTLLIEDTPISRGLIQNLRDKSINVTTYTPDTDKRARVIARAREGPQTQRTDGARFPRFEHSYLR